MFTSGLQGKKRENRLPAIFGAPAPVSRKSLHDLQPAALLAAIRGIVSDRLVGRGVRHDDGYRWRVPYSRERYADRLGAVAADMLYRIGHEFRRDEFGVFCIVGQPVETERGPDVEACGPYRFGNAGQNERDQLRIDFYRCPGHDLCPFRACVRAACTGGTPSRKPLKGMWQAVRRLGKLAAENANGAPSHEDAP